MLAVINRFFQLEKHATTWKQEIIAGLTTFAAMSYILAVNPDILSNTGMDKAGLITVTALAGALGCFLMAFLTNFPIALAPGMSTNSYFAFIICLGMGATWQQALGMVFWNGILFLILSITGVRTKMADAIPDSLKIGIQCGIGIFIAFIGLQKAGIVVASPNTLTNIGNILSPSSLLVILGLLLMIVLSIKRFSGAIILTILMITVAGFFIQTASGAITHKPSALFALPNSISNLFMQLDILYPITHFKEAYSTVFTLLLLDMFDTIGTVVGLSRRAGLMDTHGKMPKMGQALTADALATVGGAVLGTSTTTSYIESATGIETGGRTGLTSIVVGCCFLLALFFAPIITIVPVQATAPALIMVGLFMLQGIKYLNFDILSEAGPAFITMLMIPLSFSITEGISLGILFYVVLMVFSKRSKEIRLGTYLLAVIFILHYFI